MDKDKRDFIKKLGGFAILGVGLVLSPKGVKAKNGDEQKQPKPDKPDDNKIKHDQNGDNTQSPKDGTQTKVSCSGCGNTCTGSCRVDCSGGCKAGCASTCLGSCTSGCTATQAHGTKESYNKASGKISQKHGDPECDSSES